MTAVLDVVALTHRGKVRRSNEDSLLLGGLTAVDVDLEHPVALTIPLTAPVTIAVADGMGGHGGGQVASRSAVSLLASSPIDCASVDAVRGRIDEVDADLDELASRRASLAEMGTTLCGMTVDHRGAVWFSVGDSRVLQERGGYLAQLNTDDSVPVAGGKGPLTAWLGPRDPRRRLDASTDTLDQGDGLRWLLCSDGLSDLVELSDMEDILGSADDDVAAVQCLFDTAMERSGRDNISIILARLAAPPSEVRVSARRVSGSAH